MMWLTKMLRTAKISYIVMSAAFCVLGVLLILFPGTSVSLIGVASGIMLIAFGFVKLLGYFSKDLYQLAFQFDLAFGVLLMVLGAVIWVSPDRALVFLCIIMGIAILTDGLFKLQSSLDARRFGLNVWGILLGLAVCAGVIGTSLLLHPSQSAKILMALLGVGMLFEGVLNLYFALFAVKILRKGQPGVIEYWTRASTAPPDERGAGTINK